MTCERWETWISAYHDDELDPGRRRRVEEHLGSCAPCRAYSEETARLQAALKAALAPVEAPSALHGRVMRRIAELTAPAPAARRPGLRRPRGWISFGLAPVGAVLWALLVAYWAPPKSPPPPPSAVPVVAAPGAAGQEGAPRPATKPDATRRSERPVSRSSPTRPAPEEAFRKTPSPKRTLPKAPDARPELEPLRRMLNRRPPRPQDTMAHAPRRSPQRAAARVDRSAFHRASGARSPTPPSVAKGAMAPRSPADPIETPGPWLTVVDYVLPEAPTPPVASGDDAEFVLRAAEIDPVAQIVYNY